MSALLEVRDLGVTYASGRHAVKGISFDVAAGETVALVGESGSGKSATAFAIMRLLAPGAMISAPSRVLFDGQDLLALDEPGMRSLRGRRLSMVFQEPGAALNPSMRIGDQVAEVAIVHGRASKADAGALAVSMLDRTGIRDARTRSRLYPHELSGGMQQRVVIAMALLLEPALVIADEPTSALDVTVQDQILTLLGDLQRQSGTAVLLITHDLGVVAETCSRALVMQEGSIVESAPVERLFSAPAHPYTAELLQAAPRLARLT